LSYTPSYVEHFGRQAHRREEENSQTAFYFKRKTLEVDELLDGSF